MGRGKEQSTRSAVKPLTWPRGVTLREFATESRIQIAFSYRDTECRELMPQGPVTRAAINAANGLRAEIRRKIDLGSFSYAEYFPDSPKALLFGKTGRRIKMADLIDEQDKRYAARVENGTLAKSSYVGYLKALHGDRMSFWRPKYLDEVTPSALREWIRSLDVTPKWARNILTPLRSLLDDALNDELIDFNPLDRIALDKILRESTKSSDYEVDPFTAEERVALLAKARTDERPLIQVWLHTGLRPGELLALRWDKIDWIHHRARIDTNLVGGVEKLPKTAAGLRDVDLDGQALAALTDQKAHSFLAGGHVFLNPRSGKPWETDAQVRKTLWQPLCTRAGVRYRNPYQMRHTYASSMLTAGANPWYVAQQLGHVDVQMVFQTYGKFIPADYQRPRLQVVQSASG
jgi:integrase